MDDLRKAYGITLPMPLLAGGRGPTLSDTIIVTRGAIPRKGSKSLDVVISELAEA
jgi:hypothetical protein